MKYEIVGMQQVPVGGRTHACVLVPRDPLLYRCWCPSPKGPIVLSSLLPLSCVGMDRLNFAPSGAYHASLNVSTRRPGVAFVACGLLSVVVAQCTRRCVNGRWFARDGRLPAGAANCPLVRARTAPLVCAGANCPSCVCGRFSFSLFLPSALSPWAMSPFLCCVPNEKEFLPDFRPFLSGAS